jgi:hypothetical protein
MTVMKLSARILYIACCYIACCAVGFLAVARSADLNPKTRIQESVRGYLVDTVCVKEEAAQLADLGSKHTKKCLQMPACRESGYALLLLPNKNDVLRFDKRGNELASKLVSGHRAETGWLLQATGKRIGDQFAVATLDFVPKSPVKRQRHPKTQ